MSNTGSRNRLKGRCKVGWIVAERGGCGAGWTEATYPRKQTDADQSLRDVKRGVTTRGPDFVPMQAPNIIGAEIAAHHSDQETPAMASLRTPSGARIACEGLERKAEHVQPRGVTLPRPWEEHRIEGEFPHHGALFEAVQDALEDIRLTPQRYAELIWLIDSWFVEEHHETRRDTIAHSQWRLRPTDPRRTDRPGALLSWRPTRTASCTSWSVTPVMPAPRSHGRCSWENWSTWRTTSASAWTRSVSAITNHSATQGRSVRLDTCDAPGWRAPGALLLLFSGGNPD